MRPTNKHERMVLARTKTRAPKQPGACVQQPGCGGCGAHEEGLR